MSFRMDRLDLLAVQGSLKSLLQYHSSKASILLHSAFFMVQLSHACMTTTKTIPLTIWTFVSKVLSLLFNMLSRLVIAFLPRSKRLLLDYNFFFFAYKRKWISWDRLQMTVSWRAEGQFQMTCWGVLVLKTHFLWKLPNSVTICLISYYTSSHKHKLRDRRLAFLVGVFTRLTRIRIKCIACYLKYKCLNF